ncbi:hypothetical protein [Miltoncostaea oceani]|uniref:hypothetical protein n=1 Tax=Miltoncostaea oceani TaxID=2843216 RepID=UPI001C3CFA7D|nr:hypothetical protein [Miltoncostaea oceani]
MPRSLGPAPAGLIVRDSRRLVCQNGTSNKEYIGEICEDPRQPGVWFGVCRWGRIGAASSDSLVARGPSFRAVASEVHTKLQQKLRGRGSSVYQTDDGAPLRFFTEPSATPVPEPEPVVEAAPAPSYRSVSDLMRRHSR